MTSPSGQGRHDDVRAFLNYGHTRADEPWPLALSEYLKTRGVQPANEVDDCRRGSRLEVAQRIRALNAGKINYPHAELPKFVGIVDRTEPLTLAAEQGGEPERPVAAGNDDVDPHTAGEDWFGLFSEDTNIDIGGDEHHGVQLAKHPVIAAEGHRAQGVHHQERPHGVTGDVKFRRVRPGEGVNRRCEPVARKQGAFAVLQIGPGTGG